MRVMKICKGMAVLVAMLFVVPMTAQADPLRGLTTYGLPGTRDYAINYWLGGQESFVLAGRTYTTRIFKQSKLDETCRTYCVDLVHGVSDFPEDVERTVTDGLVSENRNIGAAAWIASHFGEKENNSLHRAAVQLAVYEALYDTGNLSDGRFKAAGLTDPGLIHLAQSFIDASIASGGGKLSIGLATYYHFFGHSQDQICVKLIPEPSTLVMTSLAIGLLAVHRRRRRTISA